MAPKQPPANSEPPETPAPSASDAQPPSQALTPAPPTSSRPTPTSARGGSARGRGRGTVSQPKFAGRRSAAARQEAEAAAAEKKRSEQQARDAAQAKSRRFERRGGEGGERGDGRGGGFRGRGRGGYVGAGGPGAHHQHDGALASGPFSAGQAAADRGKGAYGGSFGVSGSGGGGSGPFGGGRAAASSSSSGGGGGGSSGAFGGGVRPGSGPSSGGNTVKREPRGSNADADVEMKDVLRTGVQQDGGYISSDDDEEGSGVGRMNVEDLAFIDLTKDDGTDGDSSFAPVRVSRVAHKERTLGINADGATNKKGEIATDANDAMPSAATDKKQGKQRARGSNAAAEAQRFMSVYEDSDSEEQPTTAAEAQPSTPEAQRRPSESIPQAALSSPERNRKLKEKIKAQDPSTKQPERPDHQTQEEAQEWDRHQRDLELLRSELGVAAKQPATDTNGDTAMADAAPTTADAEAAAADKRDNKVYLFQFPPVLPDLVPLRVKPDPETPHQQDTPELIDLDKPTPADIAAAAAEDDPILTDGPLTRPNFPPGHVGKLRIHASGRATLDWGGTSLVLGMGTEASFLQDIFVVEMPESKEDVKDSKATGGSTSELDQGVAMSMGQVKGKFVVTPDWDEILKG